MGSAASSPLSGRPRLPPLPGAGRGLGKFVFVAGKKPDGRRGRAGRRCGSSLLLSGSGWGCTLGAAGGSGAQLPVPGGPEEGGKEVGGGRERGAHVHPAPGLLGWRRERSRREAQAEER